jgi:hypothetical protein
MPKRFSLAERFSDVRRVMAARLQEIERQSLVGAVDPAQRASGAGAGVQPSDWPALAFANSIRPLGRAASFQPRVVCRRLPGPESLARRILPGRCLFQRVTSAVIARVGALDGEATEIWHSIAILEPAVSLSRHTPGRLFRLSTFQHQGRRR